MADIYFTYRVETDREVYRVGDEVHWTIYAHVEGECRGIEFLSIDLYESMNEKMWEPYSDDIWYEGTFEFLTTLVAEEYLTDGRTLLDYNVYNGYVANPGSGITGRVTGISTYQFEKTLDQGLEEMALCQGVYTVTRAGIHTLSISHNSGYVWLGSQDDAVEIGRYDSADAGIHVIPDSEAPLTDINRDIKVDFKDLTLLSSSFPSSGCGEHNNWCSGSDVNQDTFVDYLDLAQIAEDWLWEYEI